MINPNHQDWDKDFMEETIMYENAEKKKSFGYNKKYSNGKKNYGKSNNNYHKKSNYDTNKFNGHQNRLKLRKVEPATYAAEVLSILKTDLTQDEIDYFRRSICGNHHLYQILISNENHFVSGYSYNVIGWAYATNIYKSDAVNLHIMINPDFLTKMGSNSDRIFSIIKFKTLSLLSTILLNSGKPVRFLLSNEEYNTQSKYLPKSWVVDKDQKWQALCDNQYVDASTVNIGTTNGNCIVIRNNFCNASVKVGHQLDYPLRTELKERFGISYMKVIPFAGILLYVKPEGSEDDETVKAEIFASINKCDRNGEIHYYCALDKKDLVEDIVIFGINYECKDHKYPYNKDIKIIYDGELKVTALNTSSDDNNEEKSE